MKAIFLSALALAGTALAADKPETMTKEVTGEAAIVNGDQARAEKEATDAALRTAVEQVAGVMLASTSVSQNNVMVQDEIVAHSSGYVRKYDVISKKAEKGVMTVSVRAEVGAAQIDKDLAAVQALISRMGHPKIVIVVQEQTRSGSSTAPVTTNTDVTATVLTDAFKKDGWTILDPQGLSGSLNVGAGIQFGATEAKKIADVTQANYVLYGHVALSNEAAEYMGLAFKDQKFYPVSGEYDLSVYATDSSTQIAKISGKLGTLHDLGQMPRKDLWETYEHTAHELINSKKGEMIGQIRSAVLEELRAQAQNGARVSMKVSGLPDFSSADDFEKSVRAMSSVKEVHNNGTFSKGTATFDVVLTGATRDFALALEKATFKKKKIQVTSASANAVEVVVAK